MKIVCAIAAAIIGLGAAAVDAAAQSPSGPPRIGYVDTSGRPEWFAAFQRGLRELGYIENQTIVIERRSANGQLERLPGIAAELVRLQPRVIVASAPPTALAVKKATATIPIVMAFTNDPVALGLVATLAHPGSNVTGLSNLAIGLMGKRLELLAEIVPGLSRVGVVWDPTNESNRANLQELQSAAVALGLALESFAVTQPKDVEPAFAAASSHMGGIAVLNSSVIGPHRRAVAAAATRHKVPAIYFGSEFAAVGGLISFGPDLADLHRRAATYVDKILKGAKPADLPIEQPTKFELVVNLKTARALGITIPQPILLRADEVIE